MINDIRIHRNIPTDCFIAYFINKGTCLGTLSSSNSTLTQLQCMCSLYRVLGMRGPPKTHINFEPKYKVVQFQKFKRPQKTIQGQPHLNLCFRRCKWHWTYLNFCFLSGYNLYLKNATVLFAERKKQSKSDIIHKRYALLSRCWNYSWS